MHEWLDAPILPSVCAGLLVLSLFYLFHVLFTWAFRKFQQWRASADRGRRGGGWCSPEMMTVLGTALPGSRPTLMLLRNGLDNVQGFGGLGGGMLGGFNFTLLFAEFELFALLLVGVYLLCAKVYESWTSSATQHDASNDGGVDSNDDVHEGLANNDTPAENNDDDESTTSDDTAPNDTLGALLDVVDSYWHDTNIGGTHGWSDDAVYLFPFDVVQTAFYTLQHVGKQVQTYVVDKRRVVANDTS